MILGEFYDNGFSQKQTQLMQSSSKTYAGIVASKLIDAGKIDPNMTVESYEKYRFDAWKSELRGTGVSDHAHSRNSDRLADSLLKVATRKGKPVSSWCWLLLHGRRDTSHPPGQGWPPGGSEPCVVLV